MSKLMQTQWIMARPVPVISEAISQIAWTPRRTPVPRGRPV
jgi:hypothetical protein